MQTKRRIMWQRIQTLYLGLAIIINGVIAYLSFWSLVADSIVRSIFSVYAEAENAESTVILPSKYVLLVALLSLLLSLIIILIYKKRQNQIKLGKLNLILQTALVVFIFLSIDQSANSGIQLVENVAITYSMGTYLSLIPIVFIFLAVRAIRKDEALVRAADRIR